MRNKCFGCEYFGGFKGCIVKCDLGYQNISIKHGCSDFTPDNTAECGDCFYKKSMKNWIVDCSVRGKMDGTQTYYYEYARKEDITSPTSPEVGLILPSFLNCETKKGLIG